MDPRAYTRLVNGPTQARQRARRAVWLGGVLVTLAGLLGMHGLGGHGTGTGLTPTTHSSVVSHPSAEPIASVATVASSLTHLAAPHDPAGGTGMDMGMDMGGAAMCLAVLALTLLALVGLLRSTGVTRLVLLASRPARAPAVRGREPAPPDLHALSIQRC